MGLRNTGGITGRGFGCEVSQNSLQSIPISNPVHESALRSAFFCALAIAGRSNDGTQFSWPGSMSTRAIALVAPLGRDRVSATTFSFPAI